MPVDYAAFRDGIFAMRTRRFGNIGEILVKRIAGAAKGHSKYHDLFDEAAGRRIEVKVSCVQRAHDEPVTEANVIDAILSGATVNRAVAFEERVRVPYDCNIQQVKPAEFDLLYYGLFFYDRVSIFHVHSNEVPALPGYSDKQHKGNVGEGQFHISNKNVEQHIGGRLLRHMTYEELYELLAGG
jgi:hypothetical protein